MNKIRSLPNSFGLSDFPPHASELCPVDGVSPPVWNDWIFLSTRFHNMFHYPPVPAIPLCCLQCYCGQVMRLLEWFLQVKVVMVEIASTVSFGMLLAWLLWKEYKRLFR